MSAEQSDPIVSVVVPLYNKRTVVARTLQSVLGQSFQSFEIIVVDDGSTDGGAEAAAAADPRIVVVRQANSGPGAARNRGLAMSRGNYVTFLDADDEWLPGLLETAVRALEAHPQCGAFTAAFMVEPQGFDRWEGLGFSEGPWALEATTPRPDVFNCLFAFHSVTAVYRRSVALACGGHHEERCTFGEDVPFWLRVLLNHPIYRHVRPLGRYNMADSELGIGARGDKVPVEPVLLTPDIVRDACPPELRDVLELWLAKHACRAAFMQLGRGQGRTASQIAAKFPHMRTLGPEYLKLRLRLMLSQLRPAQAAA